ncbi:MAG: AI-2E family transporter [Candidatus Paceibacterota bacterium]
MLDLLGGPRVSISTGTIIRFFIVAVFIVSLYFLFEIVMVVLASIVIASSIEPVIRRLRHYFRFPRLLSVILLYLLMITVLAGMLIYFVPLLISDVGNFLSSLPSSISLMDLWRPLTALGFDLSSSSAYFSSQTIPLSDFVSTIQTFLVGTGDGAVATASILFSGFASFIIIIVLAFYFSLQEDGVDDFLRIVTPIKKHEYIIGLWKRSQRKIGLWLQGQVVLGIIVGALVYITLKLMGIPYALALAVFAGMFEIIPVFGPIISAVPAVLLAFAGRGAGTGLLVAVLYFVIQQLENQVFYPLVVKKIVGINPIIVILAIIIGGKLAGILGAIIAVPFAAAVLEYVNDLEKNKKAEMDATSNIATL